MKNMFSNEVLNSFATVNKLLFHLAKKDAEKGGITLVQLKALYKLSAHPSISLAELAENLKLTNSTVSGLVDRLVQSGLVERKTSAGDRRAVEISLTEKGENKLKQMVKEESVLVKKLKKIEQDLSPQQIDRLLELHKQIADILREEE